MRIVVLEADAAGVSFDELKSFGELITYEHTPQDLVIERISDADIVVVNKCILDESVLSRAKNLKLICEAVLDVFEKEPISTESPLMHYIEKYRGTPDADRLLLTPHIAWAPLETRQRLVSDIGKSIEAWLKGENRSRVV